VEAFFAFQIACQLALLLPGLGPARMVVRVAAFGASLGLLLLCRPIFRKHPATWPALGVLGLMFVSVLHPTTNTLTAGLAQAALYAAILAPLLWLPGMRVDESGLRRILLLLWGFHTASALVGVVQVTFPGALTPQVSSVVAGQGDWYVEDMKITLANGARVFRPMGLSDYPGGAAMAGFYVVLLGLGLWTGERNPWMKLAYLASLPAAMFCLYLSQMRSVLVMTGVCSVALVGLLALRGEGRRVIGLVVTLAGTVALSFAWAVWVGGDAASKRLASLIEDKPGEVYYSNRGHFLDETVNVLLPKYPLGAGLGRWGMMCYYFGEKDDPEHGEIWAEIQWTGWVLDGGIPLVLLYCAAMGAAFAVAGRVALSRSSGVLGLMGAIVFAYDVGALAMTFNYPLFIGQSGLEFWILNACLFAAWEVRRRSGVPRVAIARRRILRAKPQAKRLALPARGEVTV
jgi:hypothetical protein